MLIYLMKNQQSSISRDNNHLRIKSMYHNCTTSQSYSIFILVTAKISMYNQHSSISMNIQFHMMYNK